MSPWLLLAGLSGAIGVAAGAYGWHGLGADEGGRQMFDIAATYQLVHALALLAVAWLAETRRGRAAIPVHIAGACFVLGTVLFSGTLYAFVLRGALPVEGAAPVGGTLLILGWLALAAAAVLRNPLAHGPAGADRREPLNQGNP